MTLKLTNEKLDAVCKYLPYFESKDFTPGAWENMGEEDTASFYNYNDMINEFIYELYEQGFIIGFNWPKWQSEAMKYQKDPDLIDSADLLTIQKLLTLHIRKERFQEGHLAEIIKSGFLQKILKRLVGLKENTSSL